MTKIESFILTDENDENAYEKIRNKIEKKYPNINSEEISRMMIEEEKINRHFAKKFYEFMTEYLNYARKNFHLGFFINSCIGMSLNTANQLISIYLNLSKNCDDNVKETIKTNANTMIDLVFDNFKKNQEKNDT
jgi:DNA replicative helicase MCM subunit Mcm2 (Cdc46/Mcm family)